METVLKSANGEEGLASLLTHGLGAFGRIRKAQERARSGERAARDAEAQAGQAMEKAEQQARMVREKNNQEHDELVDAQRKRRATRRVRWGKSGVRMSGSPLLVASGREAEDEKVGSGLLRQGLLEEDAVLASGRRAASDYLARASENRRAAKRELASGYFNAAGSLLTSGVGRYGKK